MLRSGYTLIELLVVITILALIAALAAPAGGHLILSMRIRTQETLLAEKLRALQNEAVRTQKTITLEPTSNALMTTTGHVLAAPNGWPVHLSASMSFYPDGTSDGGRLTLHTSSEDVALNVAWLTGKITMGATDAQ